VSAPPSLPIARVRALLDRAARLAARGHGGAEPNPMVGCVIATREGDVIADGYHRRCGGPHAEVDALAAAGARARGAIAIVTLEPCNHRGRTGPCSEALADAGIAEVIYAVADPNPLAKGGAARLRERGIPAFHVPHAASAELSLPFLRRVRSGLPWISAKWAQSIDGAIALANGDSRWLSCARSRRMVHRERGRVDAVLTGIGTVLEDDPRLTARDVRILRPSRRIVFDPDARTPVDARLFEGDPALCALLVRPDDGSDAAYARRLAALAARGARVLPLGNGDRLEPAMRALAADGVSTVLVEAGGGLVGRLLREKLLDEAWVFVAPLVVADDVARRSARGLAPEVLAEIPRARLLSVRRRGEDALLHYRWTPLDAAT
jgi:diaminohydroxyphosphoribosylaminopyrimidine deaminase/5-amino-6-(5-phosphoribosylamino)uracil reductase